MTMTEPELRALEELEARATKGPWDADKILFAGLDYDSIGSRYDRKLTAALRNAAPELIASARRVVELERERPAMVEEIAFVGALWENAERESVRLQSRLAAAEVENARLMADNIRAHEALAPALRRLADAEKVVEALETYTDVEHKSWAHVLDVLLEYRSG